MLKYRKPPKSESSFSHEYLVQSGNRTREIVSLYATKSTYPSCHFEPFLLLQFHWFQGLLLLVELSLVLLPVTLHHKHITNTT